MIAFDSGAESGESKKRRKKLKATQPPSWLVQEVINRVNDCCITGKACPDWPERIAPLILRASYELHGGRIWLIDRRNPNLVHNYFYERKVS